MKLAITGHRASKVRHLEISDMLNSFRTAFQTLRPSYIYEGQADGADLLAASIAYNLRIPYEAVLPYAGHSRMVMGTFWKNYWEQALRFADRVEILSDATEYPGHWCMHNRNRYMVDHADEVLAFWDGGDSGGTASTVKYAKSKGKTVHIISPVTLELTLGS